MNARNKEEENSKGGKGSTSANLTADATQEGDLEKAIDRVEQRLETIEVSADPLCGVTSLKTPPRGSDASPLEQGREQVSQQLTHAYEGADALKNKGECPSIPPIFVGLSCSIDARK
jgi:hypothetical protein